MIENSRQLLSIKNALVYGIGGAFAIVAGMLAGNGDYRRIGMLFGAAVCAVVIMRDRYHLPILIMLAMMPGRGLLLRGMGYWDAFALLAITSLFLRMLTNRNAGVPMTGRRTWILTAMFSGVFTGHVVANFLGVGTGSEGGFQTGLVGVLTILVGYGILTERFSFSEIHRLPWLGLFPGMFEGVIEIANFVFPAALSVTYMLYSNSLNWETLVAMRTGGEVTRLAGLRSSGFCLALLGSVGFVFVRRLFSWRGMLVGLTLLASLALILIAGYRSYVLAFVVALTLATLARSRRLVALMALLLAGVFAGLWFYNNNVAPLPLQVQRILCWLPGKWDATTMQSANVGLEWRREVWARFMYSTFPEHPWFGQGIRYFPTEAEGLSLTDTELYAVTQRTHSGFFSALDHVGIIGTTALVLASLRAYWNCLYLLLARRRKLAPWMVWVILLYASEQGWYWVTGNFRASFMPFALSMCMLEVIRRKTGTDTGIPASAEQPPVSAKAGTA